MTSIQALQRFDSPVFIDMKQEAKATQENEFSELLSSELSPSDTLQQQYHADFEGELSVWDNVLKAAMPQDLANFSEQDLTELTEQNPLTITDYSTITAVDPALHFAKANAGTTLPVADWELQGGNQLPSLESQPLEEALFVPEYEQSPNNDYVRVTVDNALDETVAVANRGKLEESELGQLNLPKHDIDNAATAIVTPEKVLANDKTSLQMTNQQQINIASANMHATTTQGQMDNQHEIPIMMEYVQTRELIEGQVQDKRQDPGQATPLPPAEAQQQPLARLQAQLMHYQHLAALSDKMDITIQTQRNNSTVDELMPIQPDTVNTTHNTPTGETTTTNMPTSIKLTFPIQSPAWSNQFAEKMLWTVRNNVTRAEIHLNPAELGPVSARIKIDDDKANLMFVSQHLQVREAVEFAMPKLRMLFEGSELELDNVTVTDQHDQAAHDFFGHMQQTRHEENQPELALPALGVNFAAIPADQERGLVDYYA